MIPSRPLALVDIISETLSIYGRSFWRYALFFLILFVPGTAIMTVGATNLAHDAITSAQRDIGFADTDLTVARNDVKAWFAEQNPIFAAQWPGTDTSHFPHARTRQLAHYLGNNVSRFESSISLFALGFVLLMIGIFALVAATVDLGCQVFEERKQEFWEPLRESFGKHVWKMLLLCLLYLSVSWSVEGMLMVLPPEIGGMFGSFLTMAQIYITIRLAVTVPAMVSEGLGPIQSLARSWELTRRAGWRIFAATLALGVLLFLALMLVSMIMSIVSGEALMWMNDFLIKPYLTVTWLLDSLPGVFRSIAIESGIAMLALFSFLPMFFTVLYYDLRTRHDGPLVYLED
ncbi:MAG TPA: hypothetical protein VFH95_01445 [Candidatus Kapabacteria bacterium]|nr:hypothetical protein [Candidatus Kapabacteria bacterium]